jgi:hypothetical protein
MSTSSKQDDSEDEFESADEGESIPPSIVKSTTPPPSHLIAPPINENQVQITSPPPVTEGWGDWNIDDEIPTEKVLKTKNPILLQQDSTSSLSSSPSKTGGSLSQNGSDEDNQIDSSDEQRLQRKKLRKKQLESNTRISRPIERRDDESSSTLVTKHNVKDAHHVLDRLAAQSPTRTVYVTIIFLFSIDKIIFSFSRIGIHNGVISDHFYRQRNKVFQH